jgi:hypothetical protein
VTITAKGLRFPSAMTFVPDGKLYVSNFGSCWSAASGRDLADRFSLRQLLRIKSVPPAVHRISTRWASPAGRLTCSLGSPVANRRIAPTVVRLPENGDPGARPKVPGEFTANRKLCCWWRNHFTLVPRSRVYECRATHTAGLRSGRHLIGRSASPGRIVEE